MRNRLPARLTILVFSVSLGALLPGCARGPETDYGVSRGKSLNGTSAFASLLRHRGHEVRAAIRLTDELAGWAGGIVRFAPYPGPPEEAEAAWYHRWLAEDPDRWLIYVVRDFDTLAEYWKDVRDSLSEATEADRRTEAEEKRGDAANWVDRLPHKPKKTGNREDWFTVESAAGSPKVCAKLEGLWAEGIDARAAALTLHEAIQSDRRSILLSGDDKPLVLDKSVIGRGRILIVANGSFLLNEALVKAARRPLAERVAGWPESEMQHVAFVEGSSPTGAVEGNPSLWALLGRLPVLRWVAIQMAVAGVLASLARAPRLGRPRPDPVSGADRPAAHAEALGALLERAAAAGESRELLERYRAWRSPHTARESGRQVVRSRDSTAAGVVPQTAARGESDQNDSPNAAMTQTELVPHATMAETLDGNGESATALGDADSRASLGTTENTDGHGNGG
jgi:uncharacterized protein DUF4350